MTLVIFLGPEQRVTILDFPNPAARLAVQINSGKIKLAAINPDSDPTAPFSPSYMARQVGDYVVVSDPIAFTDRKTHHPLPAAHTSLRERQVLRRLANGATSKQIALEMKIAARTVRTYTGAMKRRFGAQNLAQLISLAVMMGII
jgi:DNA-binding CsgD family transcriptional regulator